MPIIFDEAWSHFQRKENKYKKALEEILNLTNHFEYVDEWIEAEAYNKAKEIAKEALKHDEV